jgi:hypothetical protein
MSNFPESKPPTTATSAQAYIEPNDQNHGTLRFVFPDSVELIRVPLPIFSLLGNEIHGAMRKQDFQSVARSPANDQE